MEQYLISKTLLTNIPELLQTYISKQSKQASNYDEYVAWTIDFDAFLVNELNYSKPLDNSFKTMFNNKTFQLNKPSIFKFEDNHYCIFKNEETGTRLLHKLEKISKNMIELRDRAQYLIKYHPKPFITKANLIKYKSMNIDELREAIDKILPHTLSDIGPENICVENLKVDIDLVQADIVKSLSKNGVKKEFNAIRHFYQHHFFDNSDFDFKIFKGINGKASDLVGDIYKKHWHTLGDLTFMNSLSGELNNYFHDTTYITKPFVMSNSDFFLRVRTDIKDELNELLDNTTASALLFQDKEFKHKQDHFCYINNRVLNNKTLMSDISRYKDFCLDYSFLPHQKLYVDQVISTLSDEGIRGINDFGNLKIKQFIFLFDNGKDKESYELFLSNFDSEYTINDMLSSFGENGMGVLTSNSSFFNITNAMAGFFLLLFDSIRIVQGKSNSFDIYKSLFANSKTTNETFHQKSIAHIYLISVLLFDGELVVYENMLLKSFLEDDFFISNKYSDKMITDQQNNLRIIQLESLYLNLKNYSDFYIEMREIAQNKPLLKT